MAKNPKNIGIDAAKKAAKALRKKNQCWAHKGFLCLDCEKCTMHIEDGVMEYYMVQNELWEEAKAGPDEGMLCIGCLEKRLGRELTAKDFTDCPLNASVRAGGWGASERLVERINRE